MSITTKHNADWITR